MHSGMAAIRLSELILPAVETAVGVTPEDREGEDESGGHLAEFFRIGAHGFATDVYFAPKGKELGTPGSVAGIFNYARGGDTAASTSFRKTVGKDGWEGQLIVYGRPSNPAAEAWQLISNRLAEEFPVEFREDERGIYHVGSDETMMKIFSRIAALIRTLPVNDQSTETPKPAA